MMQKPMDNISTEEKSLLNALIYYDIFDHPLSYEELCRSSILHKVNSGRKIREAIHKLQARGLIGEKKQYYFLGKKDWSVDSRLAEKNRVNRFMKIARISSRLIATFPFVRGIFISGALSKDRVEKKGDIDFFIITEPGKLWIARTLLVMFKKLFLFNSYKYFCLNYFIDENSLETPNKNLYTATDVVTLIPVYNLKIYEDFVQINKWAYAYYPNYPRRKGPFNVKPYSGILKKIMESVFRNSPGRKLDDYFMRKTLHHRRKKFNDFSNSRFNKAFITEKNISTHHPNDFQDKVLDKFRHRQEAFEKRHMLSLHDLPGFKIKITD